MTQEGIGLIVNFGGQREVDDDSWYRFSKRIMIDFSNSEEIENSCLCDGENGTSAFASVINGLTFSAGGENEFERQNLINYCMMAAVSTPKIFIPLPETQSNESLLGLKFSAGSDPEPWRCKRTDGKKWRCSRDIFPGQKYCERHAQKYRAHSTKPMEIQPHQTTYDQNRRYIERFASGGNTGMARASTCYQPNPYYGFSSPSSPPLGFTVDNTMNMNMNMNMNTSLYRPGFVYTDPEFLKSYPYAGGGIGPEVMSHQLNYPFLNNNMDANVVDTIQQAQHFVVAESEGQNYRQNNYEDNRYHGLNQESQSSSLSSSSIPGGPLGEVVCLATGSSLPSPCDRIYSKLDTLDELLKKLATRLEKR